MTHGDLVSILDNTLMVDIGVVKAKEKKNDSTLMHSRIESRQKYYDNTEDVLQSFQLDGKDHSRKLATLYKVSNAISGIRDLDELLQMFLEILLEEFKAGRGLVMLMDDIRKKFVPAASLPKGDTPQISSSIVEEILKSKESILSENILEDTRFNTQESLISQNIMFGDVCSSSP